MWEASEMDDSSQRKQLRLKDYDYSQAGYYFITICTYNRKNMFGSFVGADSISAFPKILLNDAGILIERVYLELVKIFSLAKLHEYVIMPNHFHGIIEITHMNDIAKRADMESAPTELSLIMQTFKRYTTVEYIKMVKQSLLPVFDKQIWQRNYYEQIIRNEQELQKIREYITYNPAKWHEDEYFE
jgi:putative transposase